VVPGGGSPRLVVLHSCGEMQTSRGPRAREPRPGSSIAHHCHRLPVPCGWFTSLGATARREVAVAQGA